MAGSALVPVRRYNKYFAGNFFQSFGKQMQAF
jgi:hypothetical protein